MKEKWKTIAILPPIPSDIPNTNLTNSKNSKKTYHYLTHQIKYASQTEPKP